LVQQAVKRLPVHSFASEVSPLDGIEQPETGASIESFQPDVEGPVRRAKTEGVVELERPQVQVRDRRYLLPGKAEDHVFQKPRGNVGLDIDTAV